MFDNKLDTDPYLDRLLELSPKIHDELLIEFLKYPETKVALTRHETTSSDILLKINEEDKTQSRFILSHPNCPKKIIAETLKSGSDDDLIALAQNPSLTMDQVRILAKSSYDPVLTWVCRRLDCPSEILEDMFTVIEKQLAPIDSFDSSNPKDESSIFSDDEFLFDESDDYSLMYKLDESLLEAIAGNPNTPDGIFKKMMAMDVKREWFFGGCLGSTLLRNPSVFVEDKAFLSLQGLTANLENENRINSMLEYYGLPTSQAFEIVDFPLAFLKALNEVGHPAGLLHPDLEETRHEYDFNEIVDGWIKHETIYRTLWPELTERGDVSFHYYRSSHDGDRFFFECKGVELNHDFSRGAHTYNSMSYPFIDRSWVETDEGMDLAMSQENFSYRDLEELLDYSEDSEQLDLILAAVISKSSWDGEIEAPVCSLTEKGKEFVCEWAESHFEDDRDVKVVVHPEKALPYKWSALSVEKMLKLTQIIIKGYEEKVDTKYQFAEHFLTCIALLRETPPSLIELLSKIDSNPVQQALNVR